MSINGKLPAFPTHTKDGLSKRELLAAMILQGMASNSELVPLVQELAVYREKHGETETVGQMMATKSVTWADELLSALENTPEEVHVDA